MISIWIVNASAVLRDDQVAAYLPALQVADDSLLRPAWSFDPCAYTFKTWNEFAAAPPGDDVWPVFVNRHSTDPTALGWHDYQARKTFGRIFAGDSILDRTNWMVDLSHECFEMRGNPVLTEYVKLPNGQTALRELCDPVEADSLAIGVRAPDGSIYPVTDFVLPAYFSGAAGPWDYQQRLAGPCPALAPGGYQSLYVAGEWQQVTVRRLGAPISKRAERWSAGSPRQKLMIPPP